MRILLIAALISATAAFTSAQPFTGDYYTVGAGGGLFRTTPAGTTTSLVQGGTFGDGIAMSYDNQGVLWSVFGNTFTTVASSINEYRNGTNTVLFSTTDFNIEEILVNQNGEIAFTGLDNTLPTPTRGLFTWTGGSNVTTVVLQGGGSGFLGITDKGLDTDVITGDYLVGTSGNVFHISPSGTTTSLVTTGTVSNFGFSIAQDKRDGVVYTSGFSSYAYIQGGAQSSLVVPTAAVPGSPADNWYAIQMDRASVPDSARALRSIYLPGTQAGIFAVADPMQMSPTYTATSIAPVSGGQQGTTYGMVIDGSKNIGSMKTGPGAYTLNFNFPGESGNTYVSAVGSSGTIPGFTANGLNVCLNVDNLVLLSVQGLLAPFYAGGPGTLDANGNATGTIALGVDNIGITVHIVCATVSGGAIQTVSSPYPVKL